MDTVTIRKSAIEDMEAVMDAHRRSIVEKCSEKIKGGFVIPPA